MLHVAVRRWVSQVEGPVTISGVTSSCDAPGLSCNGGLMLAEIFVDGVAVLASPVLYTAETPYSVSAYVRRGSAVDLVIDPAGDDVNDGTMFTAQIDGVPQRPPATLRLFVSGGQVVVAWPAVLTNDYALEQTSLLPPSGGWNTVTNSPALIDGEVMFTNKPSGASRFFRLRRLY